jgi:membrane associated rhomboid family serine protease
VFGVGLIVAGVFSADPAMGFPAGAPEGAPTELSVHAILHGVGAALAFNGMAIACLVFARRFAALRSWGWVAASIATAVSAVVIASWPGDGISVRLVVASAILFAYLGALAVRVRCGLPDAAR